MKKIRWQVIIILLTGVVVAILLLSEKTSPISTSTPAPAQGGTYTEALVGSLNRLNPLLDSSNSVDRDVDRLIFSGLVRFDSRGLPTGDLAESWGVSQDGTIYNISLRPNVKWHDGTPLTANDVSFTIDLFRNESDYISPDLQNLWKKVEVKVLSDTQMQFLLPEPFAPFVDYLSFGILPRHLLGGLSLAQIADAPFNLQPVGSGPYQFDRLLAENGTITGLSLKVFEDYYGQQPFITQVVFQYYPDGSSALKAYQDGFVQGINEVTPEILPDVLAQPGLSVYSVRRPEISIILFNLKNDSVQFLQDAEIRHALYLALDRQGMINQVLQGQGFLANGVIFPGTWAFYDGLPTTIYNPQEAETQLKAAGYLVSDAATGVRQKEDVQLKFTLLYPDTARHKALAEKIQSDWQKVNVVVTLEAVPYEALIGQKLAKRDYQAALVDLNFNNSPDPDPYPFWDSLQAQTGQNYTQWDNKIVSDSLEQARVASDLSERIRLYHNFQVIFNEELPALPLYYPVYSTAIDQVVQGVSIGPLVDTSDRLANITSWYLVSRSGGAETPTP